VGDRDLALGLARVGVEIALVVLEGLLGVPGQAMGLPEVEQEQRVRHEGVSLLIEAHRGRVVADPLGSEPRVGVGARGCDVRRRLRAHRRRRLEQPPERQGHERRASGDATHGAKGLTL
jgi:hypothetical protein